MTQSTINIRISSPHPRIAIIALWMNNFIVENNGLSEVDGDLLFYKPIISCNNTHFQPA